MSKYAQWLADNRGALEKEYANYRLANDYNVDGILTFDAWAHRQFAKETSSEYLRAYHRGGIYLVDEFDATKVSLTNY